MRYLLKPAQAVRNGFQPDATDANAPTSNSAKAWPKRFPRKPRADGRKPNIPKELSLSQRRPKKSKKVKRPNRNAPATFANVDSVDRGRQCVGAAKRLSRCATYQANLCYIISILKRRNVAMADVLPLQRAQRQPVARRTCMILERHASTSKIAISEKVDFFSGSSLFT